MITDLPAVDVELVVTDRGYKHHSLCRSFFQTYAFAEPRVGNVTVGIHRRIEDFIAADPACRPIGGFEQPRRPARRRTPPRFDTLAVPDPDTPVIGAVGSKRNTRIDDQLRL